MSLPRAHVLSLSDSVTYKRTVSPLQRCWWCKQQQWKLPNSGAAIHWRECILCRGCARDMGVYSGKEKV